MQNKYYVLFRDNKMLIKVNDSKEIIEYTITNTKQYPNIPFYCFLLDDNESISSLKKLIQSNGKNNIFSKFTRPRVNLLVPDDVIDFEKRSLNDFVAEVFNAQDVIIGTEFGFLTREKINYITISKSCRMMSITYVKNQNVAKQKFIENKNYTIDELKGIILDLHEDCTFNMPPVYLNGLELSEYSELGNIIEYKSIFENAREVLSQLKFSK